MVEMAVRVRFRAPWPDGVAMVRFRNLVVHRYEDIDPAVLAHVLADHLVDLDEFVREIQAHA